MLNNLRDIGINGIYLEQLHIAMKVSIKKYTQYLFKFIIQGNYIRYSYDRN